MKLQRMRCLDGARAMSGNEGAVSNPFVAPRRRLVDWVRRQLAGPPSTYSNDLTIHNVLPTERFPCGAIYPTSPWGEGIDPAGDDVDVGNVEGIEPTKGVEAEIEPAVIRRYVPPSSLGFSFFISGSDIRFQVLCTAACYEQTDRDEQGRIKNNWTRKSLATDVADGVLDISCPGKDQTQNVFVWTERARIDIRWRRFTTGWIVTLSLCNAQSVSDQQSGRDYVIERATNTLFEATLRCVIDSGDIAVYPHVDRSLLDDEEQEIELRYASHHIYAIGHGCGVDWALRSARVIELRSETMPVVEVPQMTADTGNQGDAVLSLAHLASFDTSYEAILPELTTFVEGYVAWVTTQSDMLGKLSPDDQAAGQRILTRMQNATARMRKGLALLDQSERVRLAFSLANSAMLDQMRRYDLLRNKPSVDSHYRWRPFQLAFLLTVLDSATNQDSEFRDTVDLIWFPTGGGKTEAYLGLVAFQIALRRLQHPDTGGGTTVLMRYTLRLLTRDQFIRATRLILALELIRRQRKDLGVEPISIGLWVGDATSPNTFKKAAELLRDARAKRVRPALVLDHCPWCMQAFDLDHGFRGTATAFQFICTNSGCGFGQAANNVLPCNVVDEALYASPPTMLVATVDKFARLTWEERATAFFGGDRYLPPELIIQDELHLIASALGSVAGLYEAALDTVIQSRGIMPKYIASTATIRMADQQVRRLYGRECAVFPPPGIDCDDAYFASTVPLEQGAGRIYVGYLAPMLNRQHCMAPLAAALLLAPQTLFANDQDAQDLLDAWWTQVVYHGSLQGVGNSHTAFASEVRNFMQLLKGTNGPAAGAQDRATARIDQLTSLHTADENAKIFARLTKKRGEDGCLDAVLATNMVSVGLDVGRLALMIVNGQPLTTAEYIQASSRVGRSNVPGVVFMNYYRDQARSLSHYESFRSYHEAFYRFVEPTSVTPYTYQARARALHAALVLLMRHAVSGLKDNSAADQFNPKDPKVDSAVQRLKHRCASADNDQAAETHKHIDLLLAQWKIEVERCRQARRKLDYRGVDTNAGADRLLYTHTDRIHGLWPTLNSMRSVENTALLKVL
jgi:hypothetical protein